MTPTPTEPPLMSDEVRKAVTNHFISSTGYLPLAEQVDKWYRVEFASLQVHDAIRRQLDAQPVFDREKMAEEIYNNSSVCILPWKSASNLIKESCYREADKKISAMGVENRSQPVAPPVADREKMAKIIFSVFCNSDAWDNPNTPINKNAYYKYADAAISAMGATAVDISKIEAELRAERRKSSALEMKLNSISNLLLTSDQKES